LSPPVPQQKVYQVPIHAAETDAANIELPLDQYQSGENGMKSNPKL